MGTAFGFTGPGDQVGFFPLTINPLLGPLQDNGGPTKTLALQSGSPAIDLADPASPLTVDQRFAPRPVNATGALRSDIGAFEADPPVIDIEKWTNGVDADTPTVLDGEVDDTAAGGTVYDLNDGSIDRAGAAQITYTH